MLFLSPQRSSLQTVSFPSNPATFASAYCPLCTLIAICLAALANLEKVYADWCGPCKAIAPVYEQLSASLSRPNHITFVKVNVDTQKEIAAKHNITAYVILAGELNGASILGSEDMLIWFQDANLHDLQARPSRYKNPRRRPSKTSRRGQETCC